MSERRTNILGSRPGAATAFGLQPARLTARRMALATVLAALLAATGCGQKGPLYLPQPAAPAAPAVPRPAASAPAGASAAAPLPASAASTPARP